MQKRDARAAPLDETAKAAQSIRWMVCAAGSRFVVLRSAEGETLAGGSEGAGPPASLAQAGKPKRLFRWSGALWLATMRNLPDNCLLNQVSFRQVRESYLWFALFGRASELSGRFDLRRTALMMEMIDQTKRGL